MKNKFQYFLSLLLFVVLLFVSPSGANATLTSAKDTLSNSRLSVMGQVSTSYSAGVNSVVIGAGQSDGDTQNLFQRDTICFGNAALSGCKGSTTYSVAAIPTYNGTTIEVAPALATALVNTDIVVATQSAIHTVTFTTANSVTGPIIDIRIPAKTQTAASSDNFPDFGASAAGGTSGFDLGGLVAGDVTCSGASLTWTPTVTSSATSGGNYHIIRCTAAAQVLPASSAMTVTIGNTNKLINPAPVTSGHTRGSADAYAVVINENDSGSNLVDSVTVVAAPVEGVLVSAYVPQSLTFAIAGVTGTQCGKASTVTATYTTVPFGQTLSQVQVAHQSLTVTTNGAGGYAVGVLEDGPLSIDGLGVTTIANTNCPSAGTCTNSGGTITPADWTTTTASGFGFSLSGADAVFAYNSGGTFMAAPFSTTVANVMSNAGPVSSSVVYVCYQLAVSGTQQAGNYLGKLTYIATPKF